MIRETRAAIEQVGAASPFPAADPRPDLSDRVGGC